MSSVRKRKHLTLAERVKVIEKSSKGEASKNIALSFGVGKTQIQSILSDKDNILKRWEAGESSTCKLSKSRKCLYQPINDKVYEWFLEARRKGYPVNGALVQEQANLIAMEIGGFDDFQASNGWFDKWKKRYVLFALYF